MKTIIINASPRKNWNTDLMLKKAEEGAKASGAETEYINLYDLNYTGCRSCLACKAKNAERNKCYWKDDLSPVIDKILAADAVIIGSPIFMGEPTAGFRALYERLGFCVLSYDGGEPSYYDSKLNVGLIYTMNAPAEYYESTMKPALATTEHYMGVFFKGKVKSIAACNTLQVNDYDKFAMGAFDAETKKASREKVFPEDLAYAYSLGQEMSCPN